VKIDKLSRESYVEQTLEILAALRKLGDTLRPDEESFLASHATDSLRLFEKVDQEQLGEILLPGLEVGKRISGMNLPFPLLLPLPLLYSFPSLRSRPLKSS